MSKKTNINKALPVAVRTQRELAVLIGCDDSLIRSWRQKGWTVFDNKNRYLVIPTVKNVFQKRQQAGALPGTDSLTQFIKKHNLIEEIGLVSPPKKNEGEGEEVHPLDAMNAAKLREREAVADLRETQAAKLRGELVVLADVQMAYTQALSEAKAAIESLPSRVARLVVGMSDVHEIRRVIAREVEILLAGVSDSPPKLD